MSITESKTQQRQLAVPSLLWWRLYCQLRRRGAGVRESGAFLLGRRGINGVDKVRRFVLYDDLDAECLANGYVDFHANGFARLWAECRQRNLDVLADVHSHPGSDASQSETDRTHPMIGERGHVAIIVPNFAQDWPWQLGGLHAYEYDGNYRWVDWSRRNRRKRIRFTWM